MAKTTFTLKERPERERIVRAMILEGKSITEMAKEVQTTPQAMAAFMKRRGWKTQPK